MTANNAWLQECPRPLTKITWDNAAIISIADAEELGMVFEEGSPLVGCVNVALAALRDAGTLDFPSFGPFLQHSRRRDLREKLSRVEQVSLRPLEGGLDLGDPAVADLGDLLEVAAPLELLRLGDQPTEAHAETAPPIGSGP